MVVAGSASDLNSLLSSDKVSLLTTEQTPLPPTGISNVEYRLHNPVQGISGYKLHDPVQGILGVYTPPPVQGISGGSKPRLSRLRSQHSIDLFCYALLPPACDRVHSWHHGPFGKQAI